MSYFQKVGGAGAVISPPTSERTIRQVTSANDDSSIYVRNFVYLEDSIRDPFVQVSVPVVATQTTSSVRKLGITLTGIIWNNDNPIAIVADTKNKSHLVRTGEEINRAKILSIHPRSITIQSDGRQRELVLWHEKL